MTLDGWIAIAGLSLAYASHWVRTATRIAKLETSVSNLAERLRDHGAGLGRFEESINKLTIVVERLATIEEMRSNIDR